MNRSQTDLLRILSAVAIVFNHTLWESFIQFPQTTESFFVAFINQSGKGAVLFFIYLSGYAFVRHPMLQMEPFPVRRFYLNRLGRIAPLYLLSTLIFYFWKNPDLPLAEALLLGSAHFHLYFLALILYLYLLFPLLRRLPVRGPWALTFFAVIFALLVSGFFLEGPSTPGYGWFLYAAFGLFFFQLGIWAGQERIALPETAIRLIPIGLALLWLDFEVRASSGMLIDQAGRVWRPAVALFSLFCVAAVRRLPWERRDLKHAARATFLVYVIHPFFMEAAFMLEPKVRFVVVLVSSFVLAWALSILGRRFPAIGLIFGEGDHLLTGQSPQAGPDKNR
ncbi:MAG: acyltransferase [Spirochaetales bacterium]|nr:acyltransferase [Spirochaetales bacterium]